MSDSLIIVLIAGGAAGVLAVAAAGLLAWEASYRDLLHRVRRVVRVDAAGEIQPARKAGSILFDAVRRFGESLRASALFSDQNIAELERGALAAGFDPRRAVSVLIGAKILLMLALPVLAYAFTMLAGYSPPVRLISPAIAAAVGMLGPNWALDWARRSHAKALRRGLPDALDLLVVCTEAGLGLESAVDRVAAEMQHSNRAVAQEFAILGQELRMSADRRGALARMGERTGLDSFQRLAGTLSQTLRYGTPLGQALRVLAAEMRNERMIRLEERAAKLPALLTVPLIVFILPCLFIILAGPAVIQVLSLFGR